MTIKEQLLQEIESTPDTVLAETLNFLRFLKTKSSQKQLEIPTTGSDSQAFGTDAYKPAQSTGRSLLEHLKTIGTWEGDDFEECLEMVYATRGKAKFDHKVKAISPFFKGG